MDAVAYRSIPYIDLPAQHAPLRAALLEAVGKVLDHGRFVLGPEVLELEERWASLCGARHAVSVGNGTDALLLCLEAFDIGQGDEVITAPNSFLASASAVVLVGATPRFADVGDDLNLDPKSVRSRLSERTRAIIPVHLTGRPADMDAINAIADEHGIVVIEDAAQAIGARYRDRPVGSLAGAACFSLHPIKNLGACGDAGMITTDNDAVADRLRRLRNHGLEHRQEDCRMWGHNSRMDTLQAAITLVKLEHLAEWTARRREIASIYRDRIGHLVRIPRDSPHDYAVYHTFPVEVDRRDELVSHLQEQGIGCAVHYRVPIHLLPPAKELGHRPGDLPVAERLAKRTLSLPVHPGLTNEQVHHVCAAIEAFHA